MPRMLARQQERILNLLQPFAERSFFLHLCRTHDVLWVSDLPRRTDMPGLNAAITALRSEGFVCVFQSMDKLLYIDLSFHQYSALLRPLPVIPPALPSHDELHAAYSLCRLLLSHPYPLRIQPFTPIRLVFKLGAGHHAKTSLNQLPSLHKQCAARLRRKEPLPHAAGRMLAAIIPCLDIDGKSVSL